MNQVKQYVYYKIFKCLVYFDTFLEKFIKDDNKSIGSSGIKYTICIKGNKFYKSCKCGSVTGRC
jgi:hypothetical protein